MGSLVFNADEVFNVARQIERNGAAFYRAAAGATADSEMSQFLLGLAAMEDNHERIFASMQEGLTAVEHEQTLLDPHGEAFNFFQGMGDRYIFDIQNNPADFLKKGPDIKAVLNKAIDIEKDSVIFYEGIRCMVSGKRGADKVDKIIQQEMGHIALLSNKLLSL